MKGWLDNFGKADNANESKVSMSEDFVGLGYNTKGRNYSPAWGGQFEQGGIIPSAQTGKFVPISLTEKIQQAVQPTVKPTVTVPYLQTKDPKEFYKSWIQSPEYARRQLLTGYSSGEDLYMPNAEKSRNIRLSAIEEMTPITYSTREASKADPGIYGSPSYVNINPSDYVGTSKQAIEAHELAHIAGAMGNRGTGTREGGMSSREQEIFKESMLPMAEPKLSGVQGSKEREASRRALEDFQHSQKPDEVKADLDALRFMMYDKGIYDITKGQKFTESDFEKSKQNLGNDRVFKRLEKRVGKKNFVNLMNTIASADQEEAPIAMGGMSIPGSVGFSYARVAGAAPSKGKYAKKTMASAQGGMLINKDETNIDTGVANKIAGLELQQNPDYQHWKYLQSLPQLRQAPGRGEELMRQGLRYADVATDVMQMGNFIPHPTAQAVGKVGNIAGMIVDGLQGADEAHRGNYLNAGINLASVALPLALGSKTFRRPAMNLRPGDPLYSLTEQATKPYVLNLAKSSTDYLELFSKVKKMKDNSLLFNRALLGALGAETAYDVLSQTSSPNVINSSDIEGVYPNFNIELENPKPQPLPTKTESSDPAIAKKLADYMKSKSRENTGEVYGRKSYYPIDGFKNGGGIPSAQTGEEDIKTIDLPEIVVTAYDEQYPFYQSLSNEQKKYINDEGPIGRATRALAKTGKRGQTAKDISKVVKDVEKFGFEATGVPGTSRFAGDPLAKLTGTGKTLLDLGLTASPFGTALGGVNPITGEQMFNEQNLQGAFDTLDALGMVGGAAALLKQPIQKGLQLGAKATTNLLKLEDPIKAVSKISSENLSPTPVTQAPTSWSMQEAPGLHLKSTMSDGPVSKIVEPKTGLVNVEQALAIIGKESGGPDKVALIKQGMGENIPKKMDFNEFRKTVQDQLIPLERQFSTDKSNYGMGSLGYPSPNRSSFETALTNIDNDIANLNKEIEVVSSPIKKHYGQGLDGGHVYSYTNKYGVQYYGTEAGAIAGQERSLIDLNESLNAATSNRASNLSKMQELPIENQTLILGNKDKFGVGSSAHGNPDETLGHIHFLRDAETPDVLTVTQIQSDAFQGTHRRMPKGKLTKTGDPIYNDYIDESGKYFDTATGENITQKSLLDKNHQERYLQELVNYAGERGDINKLRLPTSETAAKVQGYRKVTVDDSSLLSAEEIDELKTLSEEYNKMPDNVSDADWDNIYNPKYKRIEELNKKRARPIDYSPEDKTILKKYEEQPKTIKKLFGVEPKIVTDAKGNSWYEFDIPKSFKEGKGEIKAFKDGGKVTTAQNGQEMRFYQNGLDWKPKSMQNGGDEIYQGIELPEFVVEGKDERMKEAMSQGINKFYAHVGELMGAPQKEAMQFITGKEQTPSEAWGFQNPGGWLDSYSSFGKNLSNVGMDGFFDPLNLVGVGIVDDLTKGAVRAATQNAVSNTLKYGVSPYSYSPEVLAMIPENLVRGALGKPKRFPTIVTESTAKDPNIKRTIEDTFNNREDAWSVYLGLPPENKGLRLVGSDEATGLSKYELTKPRVMNVEDVKNYRKVVDKSTIRRNDQYKKLNLDKPGDVVVDNDKLFGVMGGYSKFVSPDGKSIMYRDVWDLQPFSRFTSRELPTDFLGNAIRNFEASSLIPGAKPFVSEGKLADIRKRYTKAEPYQNIVQRYNDAYQRRLEQMDFDSYSSDEAFLLQRQMDEAVKERLKNNIRRGDSFLNPLPYNDYKKYADFAPYIKVDKLKKRDGGIVKDNQGYWNPDNWGKPVEIGSNNITMEGVNQPLLGISDTGDTKLMKPGKNYKFKGKKVTEFPVAKLGINQLDAQPMKKLNQLLNFTNNPDKNNWLDKYN